VRCFEKVPGGPISDALGVGRHYLDVQYAKKEVKTRVWVYAKNDTDAQLWRFDDKGRLERFLLARFVVLASDCVSYYDASS
jgi:hypothetical protein